MAPLDRYDRGFLNLYTVQDDQRLVIIRPEVYYKVVRNCIRINEERV